jgi:hypothetical protein
MWEAKIRKIEVPEQLGQKVHKTPSHRKKKKKSWAQWHTAVIPNLKIRRACGKEMKENGGGGEFKCDIVDILQ